jgi:hypothetical protein
MDRRVVDGRENEIVVGGDPLGITPECCGATRQIKEKCGHFRRKTTKERSWWRTIVEALMNMD